jgi:hypothetical protein
MRDFGLLVAAAVLLVLGFAAAWSLQDLRALELKALASIIASDNAGLRASGKKLRQRCPSPPMIERAPIVKGIAV